MSENQAADKGGTIVILCEDPPCEGPSLADSNVWMVEFPYLLELEQEWKWISLLTASIKDFQEIPRISKNSKDFKDFQGFPRMPQEPKDSKDSKDSKDTKIQKSSPTRTYQSVGPRAKRTRGQKKVRCDSKKYPVIQQSIW